MVSMQTFSLGHVVSACSLLAPYMYVDINYFYLDLPFFQGSCIKSQPLKDLLMLNSLLERTDQIC